MILIRKFQNGKQRLQDFAFQFLGEEDCPIVTFKNVLNNESLASLSPVIKYMHRITFEEGTALSQAATQTSPESKIMGELFDEAEKRYKQTVTTKPDDYRGIFIYA